MNEQHREVQSWLERVFGRETVPQYEINQPTVDLLHMLMVKSERQERYAQMRVEDMAQKADEYSTEAERISSVLSEVGLKTSAFSQSGTSSLKTLATTSALLNVSAATDTNLLLSMSDMAQENLKVQEQRRTEQRLTHELQAKTKAALIKCNQLTKVLEGLEQQDRVAMPELAKKAKQKSFLQTKAADYEKHIHAYQIELAKSGSDSSIYHHTLETKAEELRQLKEKLNPLKAKLDSYQKLPPDASLAKVKVEEAKRELNELEAEITEHINPMHM